MAGAWHHILRLAAGGWRLAAGGWSGWRFAIRDLRQREMTMKKRHAVVISAIMLAAGWSLAAAQKPEPGGYVLERDADIAVTEPGTHNGGGQTVGYSFFKKVPRLTLVFRKRALKLGSGIGYHEQKEDEIYYVLSGHGNMTIDGKPFDVGPGDAILTRPGSSHGLKQVGAEDLVIMINYEQKVQ
jgi:mannose-6-phosphate isomerase-like protein (cupin superfamily)